MKRRTCVDHDHLSFLELRAAEVGDAAWQRVMVENLRNNNALRTAMAVLSLVRGVLQ